MNIDTYNEILSKLTKDYPETPYKVVEATLKQAISEVELSAMKRNQKDGIIS